MKTLQKKPSKIKTAENKLKKTKRTKNEIKASVSPISLFVRNRREELGYTQSELASRSGLSAGFIKSFELGKKTVRLDKVTELINYLGGTLQVQKRTNHE